MSRNRSLRSAEQRSIVLTAARRSQLEHKYCIHLVEGYLKSSNPHIDPFRKPLDPQADGVLKHPTKDKPPKGLETLLEMLRTNKGSRGADFGKCINAIFKYREKHYPETSETFIHGSFFKETFQEDWAKRQEWISDQAMKEYQSPKPSEPSKLSEAVDTVDAELEDVHKTSDDDLDSAEEDTHSSEEESSRAASQYSSEDDNTNESDEESLDEQFGQDLTEDIDQLDANVLEDDGMSENDLLKRRNFQISQVVDPEEDNPPKKPGYKSRDQGSMILKLEWGRRNAAKYLNANNKRPLDTDSATETSNPSSPQQQTPITDQSTEEQTTISSQTDASSAEQESAKRRRLESEAESPSESPPQTPTQQPRTQQPAERLQQQSSPEESVFDRFKASLSSLVAEQINSHINHISANVDGEFDKYRDNWKLICRNDLRPAFERAWKAKAMDDIMNNLGVQEQVERAYAKTAVEQVKAFLNRATQNAAALERSVGRHGGGTSDA